MVPIHGNDDDETKFDCTSDMTAVNVIRSELRELEKGLTMIPPGGTIAVIHGAWSGMVTCGHESTPVLPWSTVET